MWRAITTVRFGFNGSSNTALKLRPFGRLHTRGPWMWRKILALRAVLLLEICVVLGAGQTTLFWKDPWHPRGLLLTEFPCGSVRSCRVWMSTLRSPTLSEMATGTSHSHCWPR
ncbi:hypothetical protein Salat_1400400 [Sesamum alatum]|uniref:Uncharacterized protein n=1 Tax=Sesamum alatum TaxID=300844 RepID=A0AAE2CLH4_9LAMI|nr:hypothetical protein Salat_1400400 [Sesamum alatum]